MKNVKEYDIIFGIDPDVEKSGVCGISFVVNKIDVDTVTFADIVNDLYVISGRGKRVNVLFVVEAGWLNKKSNFHGQFGARAERIAKNVGANHQTGKHIVEMCKHFGFDVIEQAPLKKCWKGKDGKITHDELIKLVEKTGFSFNKKTTNQEERDSALLAMFTAKLI